MNNSNVLFMKKHADDIQKIIAYYYNQGKRIFFWGAGKIGTSFFQLFDPTCRYFAGAIDKNPAKQGKVMATGHRVFSPEEAEADVIFVNGFTIEASVYAFYAARGERKKVIELQDIFHGKRIEDVFADVDTPYRKVRRCLIGGVTVLYEPPEDFIENIRTYADDLDVLLLYDNSPKSHQEMIEAAFGGRVHYVWNGGRNRGLPCAFNDAVRCMDEYRVGVDWLITFDQDSRAGVGMMEGMRSFVDSQLCSDDIALVCPWVVEYITKGIHPQEIGMPRISYLVSLITQSGALHRLDVLRKLRYDEKLFIDEVDFDYGAQCRVHGKKIIRLNHCELLHQVEDEYPTIAVDWRKYQKNKYSLSRWYYRYRNALYCTQKYAGTIYQQYFQDGVNGLMKMAQLEDRCAEIQQVFHRACEDFEAGRMGQQDVRG
ncbi:hypothetical protein [Selenomonas montiformis]|uniref:hypothetical protein n=1 Tax=Selenomonas montiformis TaxID=2652285 RepID=UPI0039F4DA7C